MGCLLLLGSRPKSPPVYTRFASAWQYRSYQLARTGTKSRTTRTADAAPGSGPTRVTAARAARPMRARRPVVDAAPASAACTTAAAEELASLAARAAGIRASSIVPSPSDAAPRDRMASTIDARHVATRSGLSGPSTASATAYQAAPQSGPTVPPTEAKPSPMSAKQSPCVAATDRWPTARRAARAARTIVVPWSASPPWASSASRRGCAISNSETIASANRTATCAANLG